MRAGIHTFTESGFRQCPPEAGQRGHAVGKRSVQLDADGVAQVAGPEIAHRDPVRGQKRAQRELGAIDAGQAMRGDLDAVADTAGRHGVAGSFHVGGDQCRLRLRTA
ncbi:hypothetical protein AB0I06_07970 [Streptomyces sp. NPDC050674]|uniref:hypothetical protein n=1 Tax=Streptomyces sp. NPDC050674 TaxID=3157216 RepID=UPI0034342DDE